MASGPWPLISLATHLSLIDPPLFGLAFFGALIDHPFLAPRFFCFSGALIDHHFWDPKKMSGPQMSGPAPPHGGCFEMEIYRNGVALGHSFFSFFYVMMPRKVQSFGFFSPPFDRGDR